MGGDGGSFARKVARGISYLAVLVVCTGAMLGVGIVLGLPPGLAVLGAFAIAVVVLCRIASEVGL